ncbi:glycosyltransferase [Shewanella algae]|uniref:glycosyltransferase n=1 Tax=Shewanella algae TaxID=38313 RepID=UPI0034D3DBB3
MSIELQRSLAIIICVYGGDKAEDLQQMFDSLSSVRCPSGFKVNLYLHIDGVISKELSDVINEYDVYKIVRSEKNIGLANGLNKLIAGLECEEYVFRMDADDLIRPDRLIEQVSFMESNKQVDFCGGSISEFTKHKSNSVSNRNYPVNMEGIISAFSTSSPFAHVTVCFRRDFFSRFGVYPVDYPLNEDIAFWLASFKKGAVGANLETVLVDVRMDDAYSRRTAKKAFNEFRVFWAVAKWRKKGYIYPLLRFSFRFFPSGLVKYIYKSRFRNFLLEKRGE